MKLSIISGSNRKDSYSFKAGNYLRRLAYTEGFDDINIFDLSSLNIPLMDGAFNYEKKEWSNWKIIAEDTTQSDAIILITPEWHGMATPSIKNFLMLCTSEQLGNKPILIVSISAGVNGVYPISEIRMTGSKNNHACFIPDHLIFRHCESLISHEDLVTDKQFDSRARFSVKSLASYAQALIAVRKNLQQELKNFPFGM